MIETIKRRALHRAKILEGQMRGLQKMIDKEEYCVDILVQSLAVQRSLGSLNKLILENHLKTHVNDDFSSGSKKNKEKQIRELLELYELYSVKSR